MTGAWPLVERPREFDAIRAALRPERGIGCGVLLTGPAGVGKTTLARCVTESVDSAVRWVAGTESARSIPLGAFGHLISPGTLRDPVLILSAVRDALLADGPLVLGVDDAHLLDQLSATLLHQLAIDQTAHIIATVRSGENVPDAVTSLWKDGYLTRLDLSPFTKKQSIELVESALGGHLEGLSADLMWEASGGNALFLRHLVEGALDAGRLRKVRGVWQLRGRATITNELAVLLEGRIERLPDNVIDALKILSLCEPINLDVLGELAGTETVEEAEARGLIHVSQDGDRFIARFTHPLFGEVIRRRLGVTTSRRLRGQLVKVMRARERGRESDRIRLADLALGSDQPVDVDLLVDAALAAVALSDVAAGERFARAAVQRGGGLEAADLLARALLWQGRAQQVEELMIKFDPDQLDDPSLLRWGSTRCSNLYFSVGNAEEGDPILAVLKSRISEPPLALIVEGLESASAFYQNRLDDALAIGRRLLALPAAPSWAIAWAVLTVSLTLGPIGRGNEIDEVAARLEPVKSRVDRLLVHLAEFGEVQALTQTGRFAGAESRAAEFGGFSTSGQYLAWGMASTMLGWVEVAQGKFGHAVDTLEASVAALLSDSTPAWSFPARIALCKAHAALGRSADAESVIAVARDRLGRRHAVFQPQIQVAEAWMAAAEGTPTRAIELAHAAAQAAADSHQFAIEADALHAAARFGDRNGASRLAELAGQIDGPLAPLYARHAAAVVADNGCELDCCATEFEKRGALLSAADAAAQAASAHHHHDDRRRTAASAAIANRLAALCGGADTPAIRAAAEPLPLTVREREISNLVAAGLSNRQVAERLHLSIRTVEGHIYRACTKLDVADREQLAAFLLKGS